MAVSVNFQNKKPDQKWDQLFKESSSIILGYLKAENDDTVDLKKVRVANSVLSSYTKHEQTNSAREQTAVIVARQLADNKEDFLKYLEMSSPKLAEPAKLMSKRVAPEKLPAPQS